MEVAELRAFPSINKYLGLPSIVGQSKLNAFIGIVDKVLKRLGNWKHKFLSTTGKENLIKFGLQLIPTYNMSAFLLPKALCHKWHSLFVLFWWSSQDNFSKS